MELEKARTGILTMKQHMKLMKVNMGQLKQKMHQAAEETERQVRERQRLENEVNNQRQAVLLEGTEAIPVGEVSAMRSGSFGSDDNVLATSTRVDSMSVNDDEDWGEGMLCLQNWPFFALNDWRWSPMHRLVWLLHQLPAALRPAQV